MSPAPIEERFPRPSGDGRRQRHARLVLGRRRQLRSRRRRFGPADARRGGGDRRRRRRVDAAGLGGRRLGGRGAAPRRAGARRAGRRAGLDRHVEGRGRAARARARRRAGQRRHGAAAIPRWSERGGRVGRLPLPDAHARRAAHDAGRPALRRRRLGGEGLPRGAARVRRRAGVREELVCLDPGIGFGKTVEHNFELVRRLDELVALGRPDPGRLLAQELARADPGRPGGDDRNDGGLGRRSGRGVRARRDDPARARRARARRGAHGSRPRSSA